MTPSELRPTRRAVSAAYFLQGLVFAAIVTQVPRLQDRFGLDEGDVTLVLVLVVVVAGFGSVASGFIASRATSATALRIALAGIAVGAVLVALAPTVALLFAAFAFYGVALGGVDAAMNMQGVRVQVAAGHSVMSNFHAMWSLGGIVGAGIAALVGWLDVPLIVSLPIVALAVALVTRAVGARFLEVQEHEVELTVEGVAMPWRPILVFGLVILLFFAVDTGTQTWSSVFMEKALDVGKGVVPLGYAGYTVGALLSRLLGDRFVGWWGTVRVVVVGSLTGMVGFAVVTAAPSAGVAIAGFFLGGLGLGVLAPLAFAALAGAVPAGAMDAAIARMNLANYAGAIVGGGVIGVVADLGNLRFAFVVPLICAGAVLLVAPAFRSADALAAPEEE